jgi:NAD(P)-dependent dehydrogenase (short-subunit alcohol dehydrogenase family)
MDITTTTALVTGANRGLGRALAAELVARGATVYAAARNPEQIDLPGVRPLTLDITDPASVAAAAKIATDVNLLINNAGSYSGAELIDGDLDLIRQDIETHYFGTLSVTRAFAPVIEGNGGGSMLNILSVVSWLAVPGAGGYTAAKTAEWGLTSALRLELAAKGIRVVGMYVAYLDTDMTKHVTAPKLDTAEVAKVTVDGIQNDAHEILIDDLTKAVQAKLSGGVADLYPQLDAAR